ncbi:hypothetical protein RRG08_035150 [Elysia crispata]|uniref:Uncharacterized protein n=1 Tax=Elysia crispata TaxID=231223 RepID=A0AAE1AKA3_9GAST|nr:hypothetical protein RRG08_035150 [Elysia crispata]
MPGVLDHGRPAYFLSRMLCERFQKPEGVRDRTMGRTGPSRVSIIEDDVRESGGSETCTDFQTEILQVSGQLISILRKLSGEIPYRRARSNFSVTLFWSLPENHEQKIQVDVSV